MDKYIPYSRQDISNEDIDAVVSALKSDFLTQGPRIEAFEKALAEAAGTEHALVLSNATAALHLGCLALGAGPGDVVWTSPNTFVASANCALYCGADVDFVDIDPETYNMCTQALEAKLVQAKKEKRLPKILIPVHFSGQSCDMKKIGALAKEYGFHIIEDASHALGASYGTKPVGSCEYSDMAIFSFHPVKMITSGEGGALVTNSAKTASIVRNLRSHGITRDRDAMTQDLGPWYYEQQSLGMNYRMTDLQAALGLSQLTRLKQFVDTRQRLRRSYDEALADLPLKTPHQAEGQRSSFHLYVVTLKKNEISRSHREIFEELRAKGLGVNLHYYPVHLQPFYKDRGFKAGDFPHAEEYASCAISIPLHTKLTEEEQASVVRILKEVVK